MSPLFTPGEPGAGEAHLRSRLPCPSACFIFPTTFISQEHNLNHYQLLTVASATAISPNKSNNIHSNPLPCQREMRLVAPGAPLTMD